MIRSAEVRSGSQHVVEEDDPPLRRPADLVALDQLLHRGPRSIATGGRDRSFLPLQLLDVQFELALVVSRHEKPKEAIVVKRIALFA